MASAPPATAAKASTVVRSMLTHGSRRLRHRGAVTAWIEGGGQVSPAPKTSVTRAHSRRNARSLAISTKKSRPMAVTKWIWPLAASMVRPSAVNLRRYSTPVADGDGELLDRIGAGQMVGEGVDRDRPHLGSGVVRPAGQVGRQGEAGVQIVGQGAVGGQGAQRIPAEGSPEPGQVDVPLGARGDPGGRRRIAVAAAVEPHGDRGRVDGRDQGTKVGRCELGAGGSVKGDPESRRPAARFLGGEPRHAFDGGVIHALADLPPAGGVAQRP